MDAKAVLTSMLAEADIRVGGDRPWDIRVHNEGLYKRVLREGTLGAGEAYLEGWWDCDQLDVMFCKALHAHLEDKVRRNLPNALIVASQLLFNLQSVARAPMVAEQHYNTDNAMFARMLGPTMNYSCGYWKDAETLDEAQRNKMDLICRKLDLKEGMFEHVGRKNYDIFMKTTKRLLKPSGLFLLHTIGNSKKKTGTDPWINKYIFPNGMLPSPVCVAKAITGLYVMEDWHNFGADYDKTLMAWHQRFEEGYAEGAFQCSERVRRMYRYYLLSCAGAFRARDIQLWQIVLSPEGVEGGYCCQR